MSRVVITGSAGSVGARVARRLVDHPDVTSLAGIDVNRLEQPGAIESHVADVATDDLEPLFEGADVVVHLASRFTPERDGTELGRIDTMTNRRTLDAASAAGARRLIVLSSAMVYGAWADNPVPLTESAPLRANPSFSFAQQKLELERLAESWRADHDGARVAILRPTSALAADAASWVARTMRASAGLASDHEPPLQFLHLDDLADAVVTATTSHLDGAYNVAPDGWVEGSEARQLVGRAPRVPLPEFAAARVADASWRNRLAPTPPGIVPYTTHPWVIANDRLRSAGWEPTHSNEEAFVEGRPPRPWAMVSSKQRQSLAIGGASGAVVAAVGAGAWTARRLRG